MNSITTGCHILLFLNLSFNDNLTDVTGRYLSKYYFSIETNSHLINFLIKNLIRNCRNLQYLSLAFCTKITDKTFSFIVSGSGLKELIHIDLSGCNKVTLAVLYPKIFLILIFIVIKITPVGCQSLSVSCNKLETFKINNFTQLNDSYFVVSFIYFN